MMWIPTNRLGVFHIRPTCVNVGDDRAGRRRRFDFRATPGETRLNVRDLCRMGCPFCNAADRTVVVECRGRVFRGGADAAEIGVNVVGVQDSEMSAS